MDKLFQLNIITPGRTAFSGKVVSLTAPGELGYFGILANHCPLISTLIPGKITFKDQSGTVSILQSTGRGFLEVIKNEVTLLADEVVSG